MKSNQTISMAKKIINTLKNNFLSKLIFLALLALSINSASAWITTFNTVKYNELASTFGLETTYNQEKYLSELITWTGTMQLGMTPLDTYPYIANLVATDSWALLAYNNIVNDELNKINSWFTTLDLMSTYMNSANCDEWNCTRNTQWWIWYLSECVWDINLRFTTDASSVWWIYCSKAKYTTKMLNTKIELLRRQWSILSFQVDLRAEMTRRDTTIFENAWKCTVDLLWKVRLNKERWDRMEFCNWSSWTTVMSWFELCRYDDSFFDNCIF